METENEEVDVVARKHLLATIVHEFRSPLSLLTSSTDILSRYGPRLPEAMLAEQHRNIISATRKLSELLDSMLDYCRLDKDSQPGSPTTMDFGLVCQAVTEDFKREYGGRFKFSVSIAADCGIVVLDETLFGRMLSNL